MIEYKVTVDNNGTKRWYNDKDQLHSEHGPAIEEPDGTKSWYRNGQRHREDGPAIEYSNGDKSWYCNGNKLTEEEFLKRTQPAKELTVGQLEELLGHRIKIVKEKQDEGEQCLMLTKS